MLADAAIAFIWHGFVLVWFMLHGNGKLIRLLECSRFLGLEKQWQCIGKHQTQQAQNHQVCMRGCHSLWTEVGSSTILPGMRMVLMQR